jgi:hypothetical protein
MEAIRDTTQAAFDSLTNAEVAELTPWSALSGLAGGLFFVSPMA